MAGWPRIQQGLGTSGLWVGVPEASRATHVLEIKTHGLKSFGKLKAHGVAIAKPEHLAQMQVYCHIRGIDRALYAGVCKDNDDLHYERINYNHDFCVRLFARLEHILRMPEPPPPIAEKRNAPGCMFCRAKAVCKGESFPRVNCRTCLHSTPSMDGDAAWTCSRWSKPLSMSEQKEGCPAHLFVPNLVPGELIEVDEVAETIEYRLHDGRKWVDGHEPSPAPLDVEVQDES